MSAKVESRYDNPHSATQCNGCGKSPSEVGPMYVSPKDTHKKYDDGLEIAHERQVCASCYRKEFIEEYPGQKSPV
jgi:hypothetical protein